MKESRKIKDYDDAGKFGTGDNREILSIRLKELKDTYEEKKITAEELYNRVVANGGNVKSPDTVNKWIQGRTFPTEENLIALSKVFPPYSSDFFRGLTPAPNYDYQYIMKETGLSAEAITHLKEIKKSKKKILNKILESSYLDDLIQCIESSKDEKHHVLRDEYNALDYINDYIDFYSDESNGKGQIKLHLDSLENKIDRLSDEALNKPLKGASVPAFDIAMYKQILQESFNEFFKEAVPPLKALHYPDLKDIFEKFIKPTEAIENRTEYYERILFPLHEILTQEKQPQYFNDTENEQVIINSETQKKLSDLYEKAQEYFSSDANIESPKKATKKKGVKRND